MIEETVYLMEPILGSVATQEDWNYEGYTKENSDLIEVEQNNLGDWVEIE